MLAATAALVAASCSSGPGASISSTAPVVPSTSDAPGPPAVTSTTATAADGTAAAPSTTAPSTPLVSAAWEAVPSAPLSPRRGALVVALGDELLVAGGRSGRGAGPFGDLGDGAILDVTGTRWRRMHDAPVALGVENAAVVWDGDLFVVSGSVALRYDVRQDAWQRVAVAPTPRAFATLVASTDELYLVGGVSAAHVVNPAADGPLVPPPAAYTPATDTWRELPMPDWPGPAGLAGAAWNGNSFLVTAGAVDNGDGVAAPLPARPVALLDPVSGASKPLPATPVPVLGGVVVLDGDRSVLLFSQASVVWRLGPGETTWERLTMVPSEGQTSVRYAWRVAGHLVIDTGGGVPGGRSIAYQQRSGAWSELGSPLESNDTVLVQTGTGLFATDGVAAARLKPFADRTDGVALCLAAQLEADALDDTHIEVVNTSPSPCALDGQRPATVDFHVAADLWERAGESSFLRLPAGGDGGYLKPGGAAVMEIVPGLYDGRDCPFEHRTFEGMRFSAPGDGEMVPVALTVALPCPDVTALVARASS